MTHADAKTTTEAGRDDAARLVAKVVASHVSGATGGTRESQLRTQQIASSFSRRLGIAEDHATRLAEMGIDRLWESLRLPEDRGTEAPASLAQIQDVIAKRVTPRDGRVTTLLSVPTTIVDGPSAERALGLPPRAAVGVDARRPPRPVRDNKKPFTMADVDVAMLTGLNKLISNATGGKVADAQSLFERLAMAEQAAAESRGNVVDERVAASDGSLGEGVVTTWTSKVVRLGSLIDRSRVIGKDEDVAALLATGIRHWSSDPPHPMVGVPNKNYFFEVEALSIGCDCLEEGWNMALVGPTGSGKTSFAEEIAAVTGRPYVRIAMDGEMGRREVLGGFKQVATDRGSETRWYDGLLLQGIRHPSVVSLDEFDRADPDLLYAVHEALEHKDLHIAEDGGRRVTMHGACAFVATANTKGRADASGIYSLQSELSEASRDRFPFWVTHEYLPAAKEAELLRLEVPTMTREEADRIIKVATGIRTMFASGTIRTACSTRSVLRAAQYYARRRGWDRKPNLLSRCMRIVLENRASDEVDAAAIARAVDAVMGVPN